MPKSEITKTNPNGMPKDIENNFLKRFSLKKVTIPKEKLQEKNPYTVWQGKQDLKKWLEPEPKSSRRTGEKKERIEYQDLSKVLKCNIPWWLETRGTIRNLSGQRLVSLVEETDNEQSTENARLEAGMDRKKNKTIERQGSEDVAELLSREMKLCYRKVNPDRADQIKSILKQRTMSPDSSDIELQLGKTPSEQVSETGSKNCHENIHSPNNLALEDMAWIQERLDRVQKLLSSLDNLRLHSGCEKCQGKHNPNLNLNQNNSDSMHGNSVMAGLAQKAPEQILEGVPIYVEPKICTCDLEVVDQEIIDLCCFLQELVNRQGKGGDQCQYTKIMCRLQDIRKYLGEFIKKLLNCSEDALVHKTVMFERTEVLSELEDDGQCIEVKQGRNRRKKNGQPAACNGLGGGESSDECQSQINDKKPKSPKSLTSQTSSPTPEECLEQKFGAAKSQQSQVGQSKNLCTQCTQTDPCMNTVFVPCFVVDPFTGEGQIQNPMTHGASPMNNLTSQQIEGKTDCDAETQIQNTFTESLNQINQSAGMGTGCGAQETANTNCGQEFCCICQMPTEDCYPLPDKAEETPLADGRGKRKHGRERDKGRSSRKTSSSTEDQRMKHDRKKPKEKLVIPQPVKAVRRVGESKATHQVRFSKAIAEDEDCLLENLSQIPQSEDNKVENISRLTGLEAQLMAKPIIEDLNCLCIDYQTDPSEPQELNHPVIDEEGPSGVNNHEHYEDCEQGDTKKRRLSFATEEAQEINTISDCNHVEADSEVETETEHEKEKDSNDIEEIKICANLERDEKLESKLQSINAETDNQLYPEKDIGVKNCEHCFSKEIPIIEKNLADEIQKIIQDQKRGDVFLKFTIAENDLFHIQVATIQNQFLGCLYATEAATIEARDCNGFDGCITLSVTEPTNTPSQIERLVDHAFMVVQQEKKC